MPTATVLLGIAVTIKVHHNTQGDDEGKQQRNGTGKKENKLFNVSDKLQGLEVVNSLLARWNHEQEKKRIRVEKVEGNQKRKGVTDLGQPACVVGAWPLGIWSSVFQITRPTSNMDGMVGQQ